VWPRRGSSRHGNQLIDEFAGLGIDPVFIPFQQSRAPGGIKMALKLLRIPDQCSQLTVWISVWKTTLSARRMQAYFARLSHTSLHAGQCDMTVNGMVQSSS
jgi:hypothetical protein